MNQEQLEAETHLTSTELSVLAWLEKNCAHKSGTQWHSLRKIGVDVDHGPSTVLRAVHVLQRAGFIKITHGPGGAYGYEVLV